MLSQAVMVRANNALIAPTLRGRITGVVTTVRHTAVITVAVAVLAIGAAIIRTRERGVVTDTISRVQESQLIVVRS